jgi:hypothetical protein
MTPEHIHLVLNHVPVIGTAIACVVLVWGILRNQRELLLCGLVIAAASAWVTPLLMSTGESAYERYEDGEVAKYLDPNAHTYLEAHEERAHTWSKLMYVTALLASAGLAASLWRRNLARWSAIPVALSCAISVAAGVWIAESGGKIRRIDFRGPSPSHESGLHKQQTDNQFARLPDPGIMPS